MAARVLHVPDVACDFATSKDAGSTIIRRAHAYSVSPDVSCPEREQRRAAFCALVKTRGAKARVARAWDVNEKTVRRVCDGELLVSDDKINTLPRDMREAFWLRMGAPLQLRLFGI